MLKFLPRPRASIAAEPTAAADDARARLRAKRGVFGVTTEMRSLLVANSEELLEAKNDLSVRERCCLSAETELSLEDALALDVNDMSVEWFRSKAIRAQNLFRANLGPTALLRYGVVDATTMRSLSVDSLDLAMLPPVAAEAVAAYGAAECRAAWLCSSRDAINLSGSDAALHFEATLERLLEHCDSLPLAARDVLKLQAAPALAMRSVSRATLLATAIVASQLAESGVMLNDVLACNYTPHELTQLGYTAFRL